jgi:polyphosphate kinase
MQRNIYERVEVMFHLRDPGLCEQIFSGVLAPYLADTAKTRLLQANGEANGEYLRAYQMRGLRASRNRSHLNAQQFLIDNIEGRESLESVPAASSFGFR